MIDLSLIVPCYNEEQVLVNSFSQIRNALNDSGLNYEVVFVDDASEDNTVELIKGIVLSNSNTSGIFHKRNEGRGKSVADGIRIAEGRIAGFIDIDLSTPIHYIPLMIERINGFDVVTADRVYRVNIHSFFRWILSRSYNLLVKFFLGLKLNDTETGCKFFDREKVLPLLDKVNDWHWFWDTEIMALCSWKELRILEFPAVFIRGNKVKSRVKLFSDSFNYFIKLIAFSFRAKKLRKELN